MNKMNIVITAIETYLPFGNTFEEFSDNVKNQKEITPQNIEFEDGMNLAYKTDDNFIKGYFPARFRKKRDKFSLFSLIAVDNLMKNSDLEITDSNEEEVGIIIGNSTGGWSYTEPQLIDMYREGLHKMNSYVATAWFPTAPQGEISIKYGIKGYSKTLCADKLSGGLAIKHACQVIKNQKCKSVITGGVEAPITPLVYNALNVQDEDILSEGAVFALIELEEEARSRGKEPLAKIIDIEVGPNFDNTIKKIIEYDNQPCDFIYNHKVNNEQQKLLEQQINNYSSYFSKVEEISPPINSVNLVAVEVPFAIAFVLSKLNNKKNKRVLINSTDQNGQVISLLLETL
ncbi:hypothetical protein COF42_25580 [Bacillus wiedmannii]|uniref:beta-ketoacyl synthase N-terminal-like domain-containing protein n=1 Tax=Bacillus wiedmannii TaxID=1890302 RepID=UPI000BFD04FB|nr:beta-ketoacyl synthase N-terminal-like domain-containing protein [Bacillus wiedmannii]PHC82965.1 hypothetical protein COF42_25580 [Bacillus wiedmannii]